MRKTVDVDFVLARGNTYLASNESTEDGREAVCAIIESVLFEAGRYAGFRYLPTNEVNGAGSRREYFTK